MEAGVDLDFDTVYRELAGVDPSFRQQEGVTEKETKKWKNVLPMFLNLIKRIINIGVKTAKGIGKDCCTTIL